MSHLNCVQKGMQLGASTWLGRDNKVAHHGTRLKFPNRRCQKWGTTARPKRNTMTGALQGVLSAISLNSQGDNSQVVAGVENGDIQTSIETDSSQGVTTHAITFYLPAGEELSGQRTVKSKKTRRASL